MHSKSRSKLRVGLELTVGTAILVIGGTFLIVGLRDMQRKQREVGCRDNLRALSLAVMNYSDDKRFLPHLSRIQDYDGDDTTNHGSKAMRAIQYYGYLDEPTRFVCPSDAGAEALAVLKEATSNPRGWFWKQDYALADLNRSPFTDGAPDPALRDNRELSYQYTRRGHSR